MVCAVQIEDNKSKGVSQHCDAVSHSGINAFVFIIIIVIFFA